MLRNLRGEEHVLLPQYFPRQLHRYRHLHLLSSLTRRAAMSQAAIDPFIPNEDSTLNQRAVGISETDKLQDMARMLVSLWEAAQRLPEGSERQDAFRQIGSFHRRVAALVARAL